MDKPKDYGKYGYINHDITDNFILREFSDGGYQLDDNYCHLVNLSAAEFNRLASHSPLFKRMVEYIKCDYIGYAVDYPRACMRENLLTDIKALEQE